MPKIILAGLVGLITPLLATEFLTNLGVAFVFLGGVGGWVSVFLWVREFRRRRALDLKLAAAAETAEAEIAEIEKAKKARAEVHDSASKEPGVSEEG